MQYKLETKPSKIKLGMNWIKRYRKEQVQKTRTKMKVQEK